MTTRIFPFHRLTGFSHPFGSEKRDTINFWHLCPFFFFFFVNYLLLSSLNCMKVTGSIVEKSLTKILKSNAISFIFKVNQHAY